MRDHGPLARSAQPVAGPQFGRAHPDFRVAPHVLACDVMASSSILRLRQAVARPLQPDRSRPAASPRGILRLQGNSPSGCPVLHHAMFRRG